MKLEGRTEGRKKGRKEGRKKGRKEGGKEERNGKKEGSREGGRGKLLKHVGTQMDIKTVFHDRSQLLPKMHIVLYDSSYETLGNIEIPRDKKNRSGWEWRDGSEG